MASVRFLAAGTAVAAAWICCVSPAPAHATEMAAHRALYELSLDKARSADVTGASGTMAYEVQDVCDGWATRQRLQMTVTNRDGQNVEMLSDYTTWESKDGLRLRFRTRQTTEQAVTTDIQGEASLEGTGRPGTAHYTSPEKKTARLPAGTLFPMMHTAALLRAAEAGKRFVAVPLFDGTSADGAQDTSIVVTKWGPGHKENWPTLSDMPSGRFHIAFFDRGPQATEPDYEISLRYFANGVADSLDMDFGDFIMSGSLAEFKPLPRDCK
jgi:hypothetical protein